MNAKELVIISGKGGTGKTSIVSSFATLAENKIVVDCDVDAADLHLIFEPKILKSTEFYSGKKAFIEETKCSECGKCINVCRFNAINEDYKINEIKCEGCGACYYNCPNQAIEFKERKSGDWFESSSRFGKLIHAKLGIAQENSGKLVSEIKMYARALAKKEGQELIIIDGSPGIGCPVIASMSGANQILLITEPTLSGLHDAERVIQLAGHFNIPVALCINKFDINIDMTKHIEEFCQEKNIEILGKIPYSKDFTHAMTEKKSIIEYAPESEIAKELKNIWTRTQEKLRG